jgi:hypothetical protein
MNRQQPLTLTVRAIEACAPLDRCRCVARGTLSIRGFGRTVCCLYVNKHGAWVSGGSMRARKSGLQSVDFDMIATQRNLVAAFATALGRQLEPRCDSATMVDKHVTRSGGSE